MTIHYNGIAASSNPADASINSPSTGKPVAAIRTGGLYRHGLKRAIDILVVCLSAPFALPLVALVALMVSLDGGRPFYKQLRVGRNGRLYTIWKIRTMVPDADARLEAYLASEPTARTEWDHTQKLRNDPRITATGRFLRKSSLDELPQLFNVLRGDMSLVGPRPMMPEQQGMYPGKGYFRLRPGITGFWQVSDRNQTSFSARAGFDDDYDRSLSLATDLNVLVKTASVVFRGTGC